MDKNHSFSHLLPVLLPHIIPISRQQIRERLFFCCCLCRESDFSFIRMTNCLYFAWFYSQRWTTRSYSASCYRKCLSGEVGFKNIRLRLALNPPVCGYFDVSDFLEVEISTKSGETIIQSQKVGFLDLIVGSARGICLFLTVEGQLCDTAIFLPLGDRIRLDIRQQTLQRGQLSQKLSFANNNMQKSQLISHQDNQSLEQIEWFCNSTITVLFPVVSRLLLYCLLQTCSFASLFSY